MDGLRKYNVFISYRRELSLHQARSLQLALKNRNYSCFFDYDSVRNGHFDERILTAIQNCDIVLLVLADGSLDSCANEDDWVRKELLCALDAGKPIVPVAPDGVVREMPGSLPQCLVRLSTLQISKLYMDDFFEKSVDKLVEDWFEGIVPSGMPLAGGVVDDVSGPRGLITVPARNPGFVGREKDLAKLNELCQSGCIPLVYGPGGTGKTELAYEYAHRNHGFYDGGCLLVPMEHALTWQDAFGFMLDMPAPDGDDVWTWLVKGTRWEKVQRSASVVPTILAHKASQAPVLLVLDNIEHCELLFQRCISNVFRFGIPRNLHVIGTTRHLRVTFGEVEYVRVVALDNLDEAAAFRLAAGRFPVATADEQEAMRELVRMLDCHAWSVDLVVSDIAMNSRRRGGYRMRLGEMLSRGISGTCGGKYRISESNAAELLRPTTDSLVQEQEHGEDLLLLAKIVALFPANGVQRRVLARVWKRMRPDLSNELPLWMALGILQDYSIIRTEGGQGRSAYDRRGEISMHRFTRAGLISLMGDEIEALEKSVGTFLLYDSSFFTDDWVGIADDSRLFGFCPFERFEPELIVELLTRHPELAPHFDVDGLPKKYRAHLFARRAEIVGPHSLDGLGSESLWWILAGQPSLADRVDLSIITTEDWSYLLQRQPSLANRFDLSRFGRRDWVRVLECQPQFARLCNRFDEFTENDWCDLIVEQPCFADRFDLASAKVGTLCLVFKYNPQLATLQLLERISDHDRILDVVCRQPSLLLDVGVPRKIKARDWPEILSGAARSGGSIVPFFKLVNPSSFTIDDWMRCLISAYECENGSLWRSSSEIDKSNGFELRDWVRRCLETRGGKLTPRNKLKLACYIPEWRGRYNCDGFSTSDWIIALHHDPGLVSQCELAQFDGRQWVEILIDNPRLASSCDFKRLSSDDWAVLLAYDVSYASRCDASWLDGSFWWRYYLASCSRYTWKRMQEATGITEVLAQLNAIVEKINGFPARYNWPSLDRFLSAALAGRHAKGEYSFGAEWSLLYYHPEGFDIFTKVTYVWRDADRGGGFMTLGALGRLAEDGNEYEITAMLLMAYCPQRFEIARLTAPAVISIVAQIIETRADGERLLSSVDWRAIEQCTLEYWIDSSEIVARLMDSVK